MWVVRSESRARVSISDWSSAKAAFSSVEVRLPEVAVVIVLLATTTVLLVRVCASVVPTTAPETPWAEVAPVWEVRSASAALLSIWVWIAEVTPFKYWNSVLETDPSAILALSIAAPVLISAFSILVIVFESASILLLVKVWVEESPTTVEFASPGGREIVRVAVYVVAASGWSSTSWESVRKTTFTSSFQLPKILIEIPVLSYKSELLSCFNY